MKKLTDEELQQFMQSGLKPHDPEPELKTYHLLFDLLDEGPGGSPPYDFETGLIRKLNRMTDKRIALKWHLLAYGGLPCVCTVIRAKIIYNRAIQNNIN